MPGSTTEDEEAQDLNKNRVDVGVEVQEEEVEKAKVQKTDGKTHSMHYGDEGFNDYLDTDLDDIEDDLERTTWREVCRSCFVHSPSEWGRISLHLLGVCVCLYFFIFALELLGEGAKVLTGCSAAGLFGDNTNPVAAVIIGMLVTVLLQSSSTTTSIIVSLVGSSAITVEPAIYMVMGANIGTSVTNTIVAMGQLGVEDELERAFAGATVHDMFNFLSVIVLLIVEVITHYLSALTAAITKNFVPKSDGGDDYGGIGVIIDPLLDLIIKANKKVMDQVATGAVESCDAYYPTMCDPNGTVSYEACVTNGRVGLITCIKDTGRCPAFFQEGASQVDDIWSGAVSLIIGIVFLMITLAGLVSVLKAMLLGASTRVIRKATTFNGYISMAVGCAITILVQSSSVTTSVLTPLVGIGVITVEQMYPLTLGANIGTTITGILAAVVADTADAMQVALAHFFFNITGIIIWYPIPFMRKVPIAGAKALGRATRWWRGFPILYIAVAFFIIPIILLGLSTLFTTTSKGLVALGSLITIALGLGLIKFLWWWYRQDGASKMQACFVARQGRKDVMNAIPLEWAPLKRDIQRLKDHTGLADEEHDEEAVADSDFDIKKKTLGMETTLHDDYDSDQVKTPPEAPVIDC